MRRLAFIFLLAGGLARASDPAENPATNELGRLVVKNFAPRDFVGNGQVWQIAEDDDGLLYFGNGPGLVTYDGVTWRRVATEKPTDITRSVVRAPDGKIYAAGENFFGWLRPGAGLQRTFVPLTESFPDELRRFGWAENIAPHAGTLYINVAKGILRWRDGRVSPLPVAQRELIHVLHGDTGPHYAYVQNGPLFRIEGDAAVRISDDARLTRSQLRFCARTADGALLVVQSSGDIWKLRGDRVEPWPHAAADFLHEKKLARGRQLADGTLALVLMDGGLVFIAPDGRFLARLDETSGLRSNLILSLKPVRDGSLWLGLFNGAAHVDWPAAYTVFDARSGLPTSGVREVRRIHGRLYALTAEGIHGLIPSTGPAAPARFEKIPETEAYALLPTETGFLHAESSGHVFERTDGGAARAFPIPSIQGTRTYALLRSRRDPDLVWLGLEDGVARIRRTATGWRDEGRVPGFEENVRTLAEGVDGRIWGSIIGRGVFRLTPGDTAADTRVETFLVAPGRPAISRVAAWGDDLVFTAAEGETTVFKFDEAARGFVPFPGLPKLPLELTIAGSVLGADQPDHLWLRRVYTRNEDKVIYRVGRDGTVQALPQRVHDAIDTVQSFYEEPGPDGPVLWLGGPDGLMRIEVNHAFPAAPPYRTLLWTRGERVPPGAELPYARNALEFEFVAPRYSPTYPLTYQTRLIGDGDAWSEWSPQRLRSFNHLTEGGYRFEVRAKDVDGNVSAPATLAFTILPPWWRTWWAVGGYLLALGGVVAGSVRWRTRALRAKNERLEKIVATRTEDLRRQNGELARLHKLELDEKISARLAAEKAQLDVLRYQLNPHFLFNSLTSIRSAIPPALGSARATLDRLADFCRITLGGRQGDENTTVGEEIAMLRAYLDIEQTRMGELLSVEFSVDPSLEAVPLPRLLLLPLVENALKYGQATSEDTLGLKITARRVLGGREGEAAILFEIANTGTWVERGARPGIPSTGIGHDNLRERLRRHYPATHKFSHSTVDGWVTVRLELSVMSRSP